MEEIRKHLDEWFVTNTVTRDNANQRKEEAVKQLRTTGKYEMPLIGKTVGMYFNEKFPKEKKNASPAPESDTEWSSSDEEVVNEETEERAATRVKFRNAFLDADERSFQIYLTQLLAYQRED